MKKIILLLAISFLSHFIKAQNVGINATGATPNTSAMLDIVSTNQGLLVPRIALSDLTVAAPVTTPAVSLIVYNTATAGASPNNVTPGFYYWDGAKWIAFSGNGGKEWALLGNSGTVAGTNFLGTTDNQALDFRTNNINRMRILTNGNVGIGTTAPVYTLDLNNGTFGFGNANSRTESRNDAGLQGNAGAQSGFFETSTPTNYPAGATSWWHLIDTRHSNSGNNYALQISGSFFDQKLFFRKTNSNAAQAWTEILSSANSPVCVSLASDYIVNTAAFATVTGMSVTFVATKTTALVQLTSSGFAYTNSMASVFFRVFNSTTGTSCGGTNTNMQSYDDTRGTITPWSCAFSKNITGLTPGTSYTLIVQGQRSGIWGTLDAVIYAGTNPDSHHLTLTVFP
ncbi:MAG: hypothetical protein V4580_07750 [Bacteroidota bacterium]